MNFRKRSQETSKFTYLVEGIADIEVNYNIDSDITMNCEFGIEMEDAEIIHDEITSEAKGLVQAIGSFTTDVTFSFYIEASSDDEAKRVAEAIVTDPDEWNISLYHSDSFSFEITDLKITIRNLNVYRQEEQK